MATVKIEFLNAILRILMYAIIFVPLIFLGRYCDRKNAPKIRKNVEELYINGTFAIGTDLGGNYTQFQTGGGTFDGISYGFKIPISIKHPKGMCAGFLGYGQVKQISEGTRYVYNRFHTLVKHEDKFLVLYDKSDPNNAILLLDHPIKSDSDFLRYKAEIEEKRKDKNWRGYE
jgi:hypothetical protein